jgi:hypothetical protein
MPISLSCDCGRALRVKDELAGKNIRCPECKSILAVPAKEINAGDLVLEVIPADDEDESERRSSRRSAIQSEPPEAMPPFRRPGEDDDPPIRKRPKPRREVRRSTPRVAFESGWFGNVNAGAIGGVLMVLIAVVWFVLGLAAGRIFFYPPFLFIIGIIAIVKGAFGDN